jgi:hypothetical protein
VRATPQVIRPEAPRLDTATQRCPIPQLARIRRLARALLATYAGIDDECRSAQARSAPHPADDLSFMKRRAPPPRGSGIDYWDVDVTGCYGADHEKGEKLAREYLTYIGQHPTVGNATLLGCIVNDIVKRVGDVGRLDGVAVGFLRGINKAALLTAVYCVSG